MDKEKIKLLNGIYEIDSVLNLFNLLEISFDDQINVDEIIKDISLFNTIEILTRSGQVSGEYTGYNTIYKIDGKKIILSNDGSVYEEPLPPSPIPEYEPTLDEIKESKISEMSALCNNYIVAGVDIEIDGVVEHFSYKSEDQTNIKDAFDLALQTNMSIPYHNDGGGCKLYTSEQIINLYIAEKTNLTHHTTYFNQLKMYIQSLGDIAVVKSVKYGDELTGEYLDAYTVAMNQASVVIQTLLNGRRG